MEDVRPPLPIAHASVRRSRLVSPMWLIPLMAIAIGAWLAWDTLSKRGPTITVSFESAEGLKEGQSQLKFRDMVLGTVKSLDLTPDHSGVLVTVETTRQAAPLLTDMTVFWVVRPRLFAGSLEGLSTLASGSYIGMLPSRVAGKPKREFVGREDPPVLETNVPGKIFDLNAGKLGSVSVGSPIFFRDLNVGTVLGWDIAGMVDSVTIHAFVRAPYDDYVYDGSRFWDASGLSVKLGAAGVDVQVESLRALLLGGVAFDTPSPETRGELSADHHLFPLFANRDAAKNASYTRVISAISYVNGSVRGLAEGSEVTMHGLTVGHVTSVKLSYDPVKHAIVVPVRFDVQPERIAGVGNQIFKTQAEAVNAMIAEGLRVSLQSTSLITGQQAIALEFVPDAPPANLTMEGTTFVLPTSESGGLSGLETSATDLLNKVNNIPFDQIGKNLNGILLAVNTLANGSEAKQSLTELANIITNAKDLVGHLDRDVSPALRQLPELVASLQKTVLNANGLVQSVDKGYGDNTKFNRDLTRLLLQANEALNSIRALADLLARDPSALIKGRTEGAQR